MKYTILKNWHYSIFNPLKHKWIRLNCQEVRFKFTIPKSAWYPKENEDDEDWNKLFGVAYGFGKIHKEFFIYVRDNIKRIFTKDFYINLPKLYTTPVHWNSMRIGWKPDFDCCYRFQVSYYGYEKGKRISQKLCSIYADAQNEGQLFLHNDNDLSIYINEDYRYFEKSLLKVSWFGWTLKPYHGGQNVAKNKYSIKVKEN
jgi:hypothetical protein